VQKFTTTQTDIDLALKDAAASAHDSLVFQLGGDTYVFVDNGSAAGQIDATDTVVKLTGTVDLNALIVDLGGTVA
jgi:GTP cyclohydrolase III